ncbi:DNA polymerase subunit beta [Halorientalis sp. IM1011]|nr:DNA polymerase subunit beta [Halorientalis sp. IM1011]
MAFGSRVTDENHAASDLDLAVKFTDKLSSSERFQKRCHLSGMLQREDAPYVDVSDIEELPIAVAHDAVSGDFLCGDERSVGEFKREITEAFENERDDIHRQHRDVIGRIAEEGLRT